MEKTVASITIKVTVLMPPPVDSGEAPININPIMPIKVGGFSSPIFTVLKPAVLVVTDWKNALVIFWGRGLSLRVLLYSSPKKINVPHKIRMIVENNTILVWVDRREIFVVSRRDFIQRDRRNKGSVDSLNFNRFIITGKPNPPSTISTIIIQSKR